MTARPSPQITGPVLLRAEPRSAPGQTTLAGPVRTVTAMLTTALSATPSVAEPADQPAARPHGGSMPRREELAFVVFAAWAVAGLFLDGWSHNHHKPETFVTPWHALLYSGIAAGVAWSVAEGRRYLRAGVPRPAVAGERLTTVGLAVFAAAAVGDFLWHQAFGIERGVEALLSPTHLGLMTGGLLLTTGPLRSALATRAGGSPSFRQLLPVLVSTATAAALAGFFLMYLSAFRGQAAGHAAAPSGRAGVPEMRGVLGIASVLVTNVLLVGAALVLVRSWRTPVGSLTLVLTTVALALSGLDGFNRVALVLA